MSSRQEHRKELEEKAKLLGLKYVGVSVRVLVELGNSRGLSYPRTLQKRSNSRWGDFKHFLDYSLLGFSTRSTINLTAPFILTGEIKISGCFC